MWNNKSTMTDAASALADRTDPVLISGTHFVNGSSIELPFPEELEVTYFGMGCFWGAEREFWTIPGVYTTAVGYAGGFTKHATYEDVCTGRTGQAEIVLVAYDPAQVEYEKLLATFWEAHDPTQGMRQGNDRGTQYRSAIYTTTPEQLSEAKESRDDYAARLADAGYGPITTEITEAGPFFYAEEYHQQYLAKNPNGYCGLEGTGVACSIGVDLG